ncbi:hypothetical protein C8J56DRAFT_956245 [Mycena floridula]|nr:hypothetical protein C8J56DRAFT_956245 [Mycena floridula]
MSDSDEDMGGMGSVDSAPKPKANTKKARNRRPVAGPSSTKPASKTGSKAKPITEPEEDSDSVEEVVPIDTTKTTRGKRSAAVATDVNGVKGQSKAKPSGSKSKKGAGKVEVIVDSDEPQSVAEEVMKAINASTAPPTIIKSERETRLVAKLTEAKQQIADLTAQLKEVLTVRQTEPEMLLAEFKAHHESAMNAKDNLLKELRTALNTGQRLLVGGSGSALELLTRAAADEEKQAVQQQLDVLKESNAEWEQIEKELRYEISELQKNRPGPATRRPAQTTLGTDEPKNTEVIKFYEDLTNLLVPNVKQHTSAYLGLDEWTLTCVYTHENRQSLSFSLRFLYTLAPEESEPVTSLEQIVKSVRFSPLHLDNEPEDMVERLGYLATSFVFERDQLPLFLRSIHEKMAQLVNEDEGEEGEEEAQEDGSHSDHEMVS